MDSGRKIVCSGNLQQQLEGLEHLWMRLRSLGKFLTRFVHSLFPLLASKHSGYFALCLHNNNQIPLLECYRNKRQADSHEPNHLQDLIDGKAIALDFNTFAIFFDDDLDAREPLKFMAENQKQRDAWIKAINSVRIEHRNLLIGVNEPSTSMNNSVSNEYCRMVPQSIPEDEPDSPSVEFRQEASSPINCLSPTSSIPTTSKSFSSYRNCESGIGLSTSNSDESNFRLSKELTLSLASSPSFSSTSFFQSRARSSTMTHFHFSEPAAQTRNTSATLTQNSSASKENQTPNSPSIKRVSTRKSCLNAPINGVQSPRRMNSIDKSNENVLNKPIHSVTICDPKHPEGDENNANGLSEDENYMDGYYRCKNGSSPNNYYHTPTSPNANSDSKALKEPQRISLAMSICTESLKIVRMNCRFWIVGWEDHAGKHLSKSLHFGDEILEVNGNPVASITDINTLFYASPVGIPIQLLIRSYPFGQLKTLKKSIRISQKIGIVLNEGKNTILAVEPNTLASGKLPTEVESFEEPTQMVNPTITEINHKPLNPFANNEQPYEKIGEIPNGQQFDVIIHPSDFVQLLKTEMKLSGY